MITIICNTDLDVCEREGGDGARQHADQDGTARVDEHIGARADRHATRQGRSLDVSLWRKRSGQLQDADFDERHLRVTFGLLEAPTWF